MSRGAPGAGLAAALLAGGLVATLLGVGCRGGGEGTAAARAKAEAKAGAELLDEAAAARYTPPADGRLTDAQIRAYLDVQERALKLREAAAAAATAATDERGRRRPVHSAASGLQEAAGSSPARGLARDAREARADGAVPGPPRAAGVAGGTGATGGVASRGGAAAGSPEHGSREEAAGRGEMSRRAAAAASQVPADLRAAKELHLNLKEYGWVRDRVVEAETMAETRELYRKMALGRDQLLARMAKERDALTDPERRAAAERELEDFKRGLAGSEPAVAPAVRDNAALMARYKERFAHVRAWERKAMISALSRSLPDRAIAADGTGATGELADAAGSEAEEAAGAPDER